MLTREQLSLYEADEKEQDQEDQARLNLEAKALEQRELDDMFEDFDERRGER